MKSIGIRIYSGTPALYFMHRTLLKVLLLWSLFLNSCTAIARVPVVFAVALTLASMFVDPCAAITRIPVTIGVSLSLTSITNPGSQPGVDPSSALTRVASSLRTRDAMQLFDEMFDPVVPINDDYELYYAFRILDDQNNITLMQENYR